MTRQILEQEEMVVSEIEERLEGIVLGKRAPTDVKHDGLRLHDNPVTFVFDSPAKVYFFHMGKEIVVQATQLTVNGAADEQCSAGSPENVNRGVVLTVVGFHRIENATSAEGVAVSVDEAASSASIFKVLLVVITPYFGLNGSNFRLRVQQCHDRFRPVLCHLYVRIEQTEVVSIHLRKSDIIPFGKTEVLLIEDDTDGRIVFLKEGDGVVGGGVVSHDNLCPIGRSRDQRGEKFFQKTPAVPIQYDNR